MDENEKKYRDGLLGQIKDAFGRVEYACDTQWEQRDIYFKRSKRFKCCEILLSSISTTGLVGFLISEKWWVALIGTIFSAISLSLTLYTKDAKYEELIAAHRTSANELWYLREKYISLLTDFDSLPVSEIVKKRDELGEVSSKIYKSVATTSPEAFNSAKKKIKKKGGGSFISESELDLLLPSHLKKRNVKVQN